MNVMKVIKKLIEVVASVFPTPLTAMLTGYRRSPKPETTLLHGNYLIEPVFTKAWTTVLSPMLFFRIIRAVVNMTDNFKKHKEFGSSKFEDFGSPFKVSKVEA